MADTLTIFGKTYPNATSIMATDSNNVEQRFVRPQGTKSITENGTGIDVSEYASVDVSVSGSSPNLQALTKTYDSKEYKQTAHITAESTYDGISSVDLTINAMPSGSASTPATSITANPTISVSAAGLISASVSGSKSITPTVSAGYISSGTAGTVSVSGSKTQQLATQTATTITPTKSSQTAVTAGKYTTGAVTVAAIPSNYIDTTDANATASDIVSSKTAYVNGSKITGNLTFSTIYTGSTDPSSSTGSNGDIYLKVVG